MTTRAVKYFKDKESVSDKPYHGRESPMYIYATDMVAECYRVFDPKDKRVLTVVGSGDQIFAAYLFGASEVIGFDVNKWSFFIARLKYSAIRVLDYNSFLNYFGSRWGAGNPRFRHLQKIQKRPGQGDKKIL